MSYAEIWEMKRELLFIFLLKYGRMPSKYSKDIDEKRLGKWYSSQITKIISAEHDFYKKLSVNEIVKKRMDKTIEDRKDRAKALSWEESKKAFLTFVDDNGRRKYSLNGIVVKERR